MNKRFKKLYKYIMDCRSAELVQQQIQDVEQDIKRVENAIEILNITGIADGLYVSTHELRVQRLKLELELNKLEHDILEFELEAELRD